MEPQWNERLTELYGMLEKIEDQHKQNEQNLSKARDRHQEPSSKQSQRQIKSIYREAISNHEFESKALREALDVVVDLRQVLRQIQKRMLTSKHTARRGELMKILLQSASALPLFVPEKLNEPAPPLCGSIPADPSHVAKAGDMVAAFVPSPDGDGSKVWVLGEVTQYILGAGKYEIDDIDEEQKERHSIGRRRVIPLPTMRANPITNPEAVFPKDSLVLALYPQTTCFYRAIIDRPPEDPTQEYMVSFEDATYTEGYSPPFPMPQRYVIASREPKK